MGMYDYVDYECVCPNCKQKVSGFQSKDAECELALVTPIDVNNFYTSCNCGAWLEFNRIFTADYRVLVTKNNKVIASKKVTLYEGKK